MCSVPAPCSVGSSSAYEAGPVKPERQVRQPNSKILDPSDVAKAALFLLLDPSAALNGCELIADGGLTMSFDFRTGSEGASI